MLNTSKEAANHDAALKVLIFISFIVVAIPVITYQPPYYIINGDVAQAYKYTYLINKDISNVFGDTYHKGYHVLSSILTFGILPVETGMLLLTLLSICGLILFTYKLGYFFTNDKTVAHISAALSPLTLAFTSANFGMFLIPQTLGIMLFVASLYYFVTKRPLISGLIIALHLTVHASFVFSVVAILIYCIFSIVFEKKFAYVKDTAFALAIVILAFLLYKFLFLDEAIFDFWAQYKTLVQIDTLISVFSLPVAIFPPLIIFASLIGSWLAWKRNECKYIILLLLLFIAFSQSYLLNFGALPGGIPNTPSRILNFIGVPLAILSSYAFSTFLANKKKLLFVLILFIIFFSGLFYISTTTGMTRHLDKNDIEAVKYLQSTGEYDRIGLYNNSDRWGKNFLIVHLGGQRIAEHIDTIVIDTIISRKNLVSDYPVDFVLLDRNSKGLEDILITQNVTNIAFKNKEYKIIGVVNKSKTFPKHKVRDYVTSFVNIFNNHPKAGIFNKLLNSTNIKLISADSNENVCLSVSEAISVVECKNVNVTISGKREALVELFSSRGLTEFIYRFTSLYNSKNIKIYPDTTATQMLLKSLRWVNLLSPYSYPNILLGFVFP